MGYLVLQGGAEFGGAMKSSDLRAIELAGGFNAPISIIPAAAAVDQNHERAGRIGADWFKSLGAGKVEVLPLIDRPSSDDRQIAQRLHRSRLIYMLGGFPRYLADVLQDSRAWHAIRAALDNGAVVAGSSAGAMVLCEFLYDPAQRLVGKGLGVVAQACVVPHFNNFGRQWIDPLQKQLPQATLIGIDEKTAAINDGPDRSWSVYGPGKITLFGRRGQERYGAGSCFELGSP
jgi:cyanophycinase